MLLKVGMCSLIVIDAGSTFCRIFAIALDSVARRLLRQPQSR
jgi:hypothetical protein